MMLPRIVSQNSVRVQANNNSERPPVRPSLVFPDIHSSSVSIVEKEIEDLTKALQQKLEEKSNLESSLPPLSLENDKVGEELKIRKMKIEEFVVEGDKHPSNPTSNEIWTTIRKSDSNIEEAKEKAHYTIPFSSKYIKDNLIKRIEYIQKIIRRKMEETKQSILEGFDDPEKLREVISLFKKDYETCRFICTDLEETWNEDLAGVGLSSADVRETLGTMHDFAKIVADVIYGPITPHALPIWDLITIHQTNEIQSNCIRHCIYDVALKMRDLKMLLEEKKEDKEVGDASSVGATTIEEFDSNTASPYPASRSSTIPSGNTSQSTSPLPPFRRPGTPRPTPSSVSLLRTPLKKAANIKEES